MTKAIAWILVCGALVIGIYALVAKEAGAPQEEGNEIKEEETTSSPQGKKMSFDAFLTYNEGSYRCEVDQYLSDMDSEGVVYVDGKNLRGDFTTTAEGTPLKMSFIVRDGYQYLWQDASKAGVKLSASALASGDAGELQGTYSWSASQIGEYDCQPWSASGAVFVLPSGVVFTDMSAMVKPQ